MSGTVTERPVPAPPDDDGGTGAPRRPPARRGPPTLWVGLGVLGLIVLATVVLPPFLGDGITTDPANALQPPGEGHAFGTDYLGRDVLTRVVLGGRRTLLLAAVSVVVATGGGLLLGTFAPYRGGRADRLVVVLLDSLLSFPPVLLAMIVAVAMGPGPVQSGVAVGAGWIPYFGRVVRGQVLSLRQRGYVLAGVVGGVSTSRILVTHVLRNAVGPLLVVATYVFSGSILLGAGLGFLGLGVEPPLPEWGAMLNEGRRFFTAASWNVWFPGAMIVATSLAANLVSDGLQDRLDSTG